MSHELRTPMNAILGFGQLLKLGKLEPGQVAPVDQILKSGNHLLELINQVLDLSRIDTGNISLSIEDVRTRDVLDQCLDMARTLAERTGVVIIDNSRGKELPLLRADHTRLIQSLLNLLSNAVKYNRPQGEVTLDALHVDKMMRFVVTDQGKGISAENQKNLFEPFNRLGAEASNVEGTGIGLTITKQLVELMGGRIGCDSQLGSGSTFWIEIPQSDTVADALEIETHIAGHVVLQETIDVFGQVVTNAEGVSNLGARFPGVIKSTLVSVGDSVRKGQSLATVESNESLNLYHIKASISGVITHRNANPGEQTGSRQLFTIMDTSTVWVDLSVFPSDRERVRVGVPVTIINPANEREIDATIATINVTSETNQAVKVRVILDNKDGSLLPGSFVKARIKVAEHSVPLAVKRTGLQAFRDFTGVYAQIADEYELHML